MQTVIANIYVAAQTILATMAVGLVAAVGRYMVAHVKNIWAQGVLNRFGDIVVMAVKMLNQTMVDDIKAKSADGTISDEEVKEIGRDLMTTVKGLLSWSLLIRALGFSPGTEAGVAAAESWVTTKAEAAVHDINLQKAVVNANP